MANRIFPRACRSRFFKKLTGQTVAIQYKAGAGGAAAWSQINSVPGDGYTIIGTNIPHIILQPLEKDVGYKTADIANVYWFHYTPDAIIVTADSPLKSLEDLVAAAKKAPGSLTFSGSGTNSANHLAQQRFDKMAGIKTVYVPAKGTGESNTALLGKHVSGAFSYSTVGTQLGKQVRCLAIAAEKRHPALPDCPTFKEKGFNLVSGAYRGIGVPNTTPKATQQAVSDLIGKINRTRPSSRRWRTRASPWSTWGWRTCRRSWPRSRRNTRKSPATWAS